MGRGGGDLTCLTRAVINRVGCGDTRHDDQTFAETCQVFVREGSLLAVRPVHAGEGGRGERSLLARRLVRAGESVRGERVET